MGGKKGQRKWERRGGGKEGGREGGREGRGRREGMYVYNVTSSTLLTCIHMEAGCHPVAIAQVIEH